LNTSASKPIQLPYSYLFGCKYLFWPLWRLWQPNCHCNQTVKR